MRLGSIGAGLALLAALAVLAAHVHALAPRTQIAEEYDFVVVGGGQAGLVIGARLSEIANYTVLVLEAGTNGDEFRERIGTYNFYTPAYSYYESLWTTPMNWAYYTVPQSHAENRQIEWTRGKGLGGSSAINGLYLTRPGKEEINAWKDLLGDMDGADNWSWDSFYAAMKKSETFTPPSNEIATEGNITWDLSTRGIQGPIQATYPGYTFPQVGEWVMSLEAMGIASSNDMYGGEVYGAEVSTSSINPTNWTRSYSRTGYLDPLADNGNYDVVADAFVTRILFDASSPSNNLTANGVQYTLDNGKTNCTVKVKKEVILSAGTVGSPAVLLHSGVGPKDVLSDAGVELVSELPGVGHHLQDHFNNTLYLSYIDSAIAYINSTLMYGDNLDALQKNITTQINQFVLNTTYDAGVIAGYKAIANMTATTILSSSIGQIELLFMNSDLNGDIGITAALQHPYSHGRIYINSSNPLDYPVIDPNYLAVSADYEILRDGLNLARQLGNTQPLSSCLIAETIPGPSVKTDDDWLEWIREATGTEFHPSSSCAMLPREQGGVVDANLRVYGLANVRVADASVVPISLSTHLMASTYGVAEQASNIIRAHYTDSRTTGTSSSDPGSASSPTSSALGAEGTTGAISAHTAPSGGVRSVSAVSAWVAVVFAAAVSIFHSLH
ncbi:glucose dehydrogenase, putative [Talaromyces stipitatus ATCC 10500]|uniref:glucose oxidase n=1 Tax=Talaromyces stipitatus (strain ATCC 10500 / CBS 375.48 / QM 6759 / NRRL 1006) TaxID=441959 RepID=B8MC84_TALSN|nr:glucose dehydrogenase, putative [Talaromyces stipitatus ATCC 10500]EED18530.1 glucose dehydrogenase, putative [Talaromyces stipitatus ATCC 10500]